MKHRNWVVSLATVGVVAILPCLIAGCGSGGQVTALNVNSQVYIAFDGNGCYDSISPGRNLACTSPAETAAFCLAENQAFYWAADAPFRVNVVTYNQPVDKGAIAGSTCDTLLSQPIDSDGDGINDKHAIKCKRSVAEVDGSVYFFTAMSDAHNRANCSTEPRIIIRD